MVEIARVAEVAIGTLYVAFPSKDALYQQLVVSRAEELAGGCAAALAGGGTERERLDRALAAKIAFFERHQSFLRIYATTSMVVNAGWAAPPAVLKLRQETLTLLAQCFREAGERGGLAVAADPADLALAFQTLSTSYLVAALASEGRIEPARIVDSMHAVLLDPVLPAEVPPSTRLALRARSRAS